MLSHGGILFLHGPLFEDHRETATSNRALDLDPRSREPDSGLQELSDVDAASGREGLHREARIAMQANNLSLLYRKG
ncbi:DUF938 domain-containing protein [Methylorubrum extorquens]